MKCRIINVFAVVCAVSLMSACSGNGAEENEVADSSKIIEIERFDRAVAAYPSLMESGRDSLVACFQPVIDVMGALMRLSDADSIMSRLASSQVASVFGPDVERRLPDLRQSEIAIGNMKYLAEKGGFGMEFPKRVFGILTPYEQSVVFADTIMIVGLNHYLGADYEGYKSFGDYRRRLKTVGRLPYDVAEALVYTSYPYRSDAVSTAVSRMIYEGVVVAAVMRILPNAELPDALGYTPDQLKWVKENEARIWRKMVGDDMLYTTDRNIAEKLVAPAPYTSLLALESPGRVGRYMGYRIVEAYISSHPGIEIVSLLLPSFYQSQEALVDSGYGRE